MSLEFNIDAAQRELDQRSAQGEDVSRLRVNSQGKIVSSGYSCTDCILDHLASSGPQSRQDLRRECRTQAVPYDNIIFAAAVDELLATEKIVIDDVADNGEAYFDFPESYYNAQVGL
jgi:hypothetical protein